MEHTKNVLEDLLKGMTQDPASLASRIVKYKREVVCVDFTENRSILLVTKQCDPTSQAPVLVLPDDCTIDNTDVVSLRSAGKDLLSFLEVRKIGADFSDVSFISTIWSKCPISSLIMYSVALRIWGKISPASPPPQRVIRLLDTYTQSKSLEEKNGIKIYSCTTSAANFSVEEEITSICSYETAVQTNCYDVLGKNAAARLQSKIEASKSMRRQALSILIEKDVRSAYGPIGAHITLPERRPITTVRELQKAFIKSR